ncbi:hypothetical protein PYCCODRAFT_1441176, partial [Trametes coccinea BRFM310]
MAPLLFVEFTLQPHPPHEGFPCHRSRLRGELRAYINRMLGDAIGNPRARMRWTFQAYLEEIVLRDRHQLVHWPPHIPFANLSLLKGGIRTLLELRRLLYSQDPNLAIRFEPVTAEECAKAVLDPMSMHPNPAMANLSDSPIFEPLIVHSSALHPGDLGRLGSHPTSTQAGAVKKMFGKVRRRQRSDVKRRHQRRTGKNTSHNSQTGGSAAVLHGRRRPPKRGITSFQFVLPETADSKCCQRSDYYLTDDPIDEFVSDEDADEIEPASEG